MRLGITAPIWGADGGQLTASHYTDSARRIEEAGFDSIWVNDTVNRGLPALEPLAGCTALATATSTVEIGTAVLQVGRLDGPELAHRLNTLTLLSDGRFTLGAGAGSTEGDFIGPHADYDHRFRALRRNLDTVRRLTNGEPVGEVDLTPWPATVGRLPIVIGAWAGSRWIERAALDYDGWMGSGAKTSLNALLDGIDRFRSFGGGRAIAASLAVDLTAPDAGYDPAEPFDLRCPPNEAKRRLGLLADAGFDDAILAVDDHSPRHLERLRALID